MPKMKSHGGSKKRFKVSANGKIIRCQAFRDHLHSNKKASVKRALKSDKVVTKSDAKTIKHQIPYL